MRPSPFVIVAACALGCGGASDASNDLPDAGNDAAIDAASDAPTAEVASDSGGRADAPLDAAGDAPVYATHPYVVGINEWLDELTPLDAWRAVAASPPSEPHLCHIYTYWNVAHADPPGAGNTHSKAGLLDWFAKAAGCSEVLITFQGQQTKGVAEPVPSVAAVEGAFVDLLALADGPLAAWKGKLTFTAWNEPNNTAPEGNGLQQPLAPETAAAYYLAMRKHCAPPECTVAAGDFATNGGMWNDVEQNCADDTSPADTPTRCAKPSVFNTATPPKPPSYMDRYKHEIATQATAHGLPAGFRPEVWTYHPWHDVNSYIESSAKCDSYQTCATHRFLQSLGGSWSAAEIWDNEIGIGLQTTPPPDKSTVQPCGAAFLVRLTRLSPRIKRLYYMRFWGTNGPLYDGPAIRPAGQVLADYAQTYGGAKCAETGLPAAP